MDVASPLPAQFREDKNYLRSLSGKPGGCRRPGRAASPGGLDHLRSLKRGMRKIERSVRLAHCVLIVCLDCRGAPIVRANFFLGDELMVGNPTMRNTDVPNLATVGVVPALKDLPSWVEPNFRPLTKENEPSGRSRRPAVPPPVPGSPFSPGHPGMPFSPDMPQYPLPPYFPKPGPGNNGPAFPPIPAPKRDPGPGGQLDEWLLAYLLQQIRKEQGDAHTPISHRPELRAGQTVSGSLPGQLGIPDSDQAIGLRGIASGEPMQLLQVQPPIFFPFS
ncbi:hypothetical protein BRAS3843_100031 [Bradyrhizobium sp. STM 3843]|nr:hypothetical protein BRAS3843_100031 [Bradyrhizobium sp. STM 3843]